MQGMTQTHICGHVTMTPFEFHWKYNMTSSSRGFCLQGGREKASMVFDGHWPWAPSAVVKTAIAARKSTSLHLSVLLCVLFRWTSEGSPHLPHRGPFRNKSPCAVTSCWWGTNLSSDNPGREESTPLVLTGLFDFTHVATVGPCWAETASSLWSLCRCRCFKNISSSHTETVNPREKCYWILIMHTTSLLYQSKHGGASGRIVYFDNQSHEKWGYFFNCSLFPFYFSVLQKDH